MNNQISPDEISLRLLDRFENEPAVTQRSLADGLGIALGLVNAYVKRLYNKGYIKVKTVPSKRIAYMITPKGFAEKTRLTYNYMHYSLQYFKDVRRKIEAVYAEMLKSDVKSVLLWGDGELAELCYVSTRGLSLQVVGLVGGQKVERGFFGHNIYSKDDISGVVFDAVLVSTLDEDMINCIRNAGIAPDKVYYLEGHAKRLR